MYHCLSCTSNQIHWPRRIETWFKTFTTAAKVDFQPNPLTQKDWNYSLFWIRHTINRLPTKSIDPEGLKLVSIRRSNSPHGVTSNQIHWPRRIETRTHNWKLIKLITSNQIHWPRRIETYIPLNKVANLAIFQPNPLTQKDWNQVVHVIRCSSCTLPTKSIDPEGLKPTFDRSISASCSPSNQIHWPRRIETWHVGRKVGTTWSSNQIHWPRRIETSTSQGQLINFMDFQPNPLTQKDWNPLWFRNSKYWSKLSSNQIHWPRRIETSYLPPRFRTSSSLPTKSIDPEGLKQRPPAGLECPLRSSNQIHWPRRIETWHVGRKVGTTWSFQPNPLTQKDWNPM